MDSSSVQTLCNGGCGFYGSPATDGFCSVCSKKNQKQSAATSSTPPVTFIQPDQVSKALNSVNSSLAQLQVSNKGEVTKDIQENAIAEGSTSIAKSEDSNDKKEDEKSDKKKKNRCNSCRKKVGLTGFECRCGGLFCSLHRYSDKHDCQFDYKAMAAEEIKRQNPVIVGEKVQKI